MAEAAVRFVVQKLGELIVQEAINLHGVRDEVEWLERELRRMQCFLKDAEAKKNKGDDERVKNWVRDMRDVAFDAEDIIDTFIDLNLRRSQRHAGFLAFIKRYVCVLDQIVGRREVHDGVQRIKARIHDLSESRTSYGIANIGETNGTNGHSRNQDVIPILPKLSDHDNDIVGFDDEKTKIVRELVDITNKDRSVISIVGMGGLGKTTLAKSIYNDPEVKRSFDIHAWVIISQEYTTLEIVTKIFSEIDPTLMEESRGTIEKLSIHLSERLKQGKYLIVLDDVWVVNVWNELKKVFPNIKNGSRVIITTRFLDIGKFADPTTQPHKLRFLNEEESHELFLRKAFPRQDIETCCPENLVDLAHQLVGRCGGLPLALVVIGGLMSTKQKTYEAWVRVVESMKWQFVEGGERCLEILALSYNDLPYYLKSCFLYFGCFSEDMAAIPAKDLIRLWIAEGFLPTRDGKTMEEIGMGCLEELAQRCMVQVTKRKYDDSPCSCRLHDLLRDMCIKEAKENRYLEILYKNENTDTSTAMSNVARWLIIFNQIETLNYSNSKLRSLFYNAYTYYIKTQNTRIGGFKLLRVLYLHQLHMLEFPSEIKSLIHLRYLDLRTDMVIIVPSWIGHLCKLQTFTVSSANVEKVSNSLWSIKSLRHVNLRRGLGSSWTPPSIRGNIFVLMNLQTLQMIPAGEWIGSMLPKLTNLRKLKIFLFRDHHVTALCSSLPKLVHLASLSIEGYRIPSDNVITAFSHQRRLNKLHLFGEFNCKQLPRYDVFPQQLVKLVLEHSELEQDSMATLEKLQSLKILKLGSGSYTGKQMICSATGFPQLLSLTIEDCPELEEWQIEETAMPCLKYLELNHCRKLKVIPEGLKHVPLDQLVLADMPRELKASIKENTGEDWYKIQHVPDISIF